MIGLQSLLALGIGILILSALGYFFFKNQKKEEESNNDSFSPDGKEKEKKDEEEKKEEEKKEEEKKDEKDDYNSDDNDTEDAQSQKQDDKSSKKLSPERKSKEKEKPDKKKIKLDFDSTIPAIQISAADIRTKLAGTDMNDNKFLDGIADEDKKIIKPILRQLKSQQQQQPDKGVQQQYNLALESLCKNMIQKQNKKFADIKIVIDFTKKQKGIFMRKFKEVKNAIQLNHILLEQSKKQVLQKMDNVQKKYDVVRDDFGNVLK